MTKTDEQFHEALIRLTWDNGYEYLKEFYNENYTNDVYLKGNNDLMLSIEKNNLSWASDVNIERIWFDKKWIKVLCELLLANLRAEANEDFYSNPLAKIKDEVEFMGYNIPNIDFLEHLVMGILVHSDDRTKYLRETFGSLLEPKTYINEDFIKGNK